MRLMRMEPSRLQNDRLVRRALRARNQTPWTWIMRGQVRRSSKGRKTQRRPWRSLRQASLVIRVDMVSDPIPRRWNRLKGMIVMGSRERGDVQIKLRNVQIRLPHRQ